MLRLKRRVLVVEDQYNIWGEPLTKIFSAPDWEVAHTSTIKEARKKFEEDFDFDLLVVDFELPDGTGQEFLGFVRQLDENIPIFLFSQYTDGRGFAANDIQKFGTIPFFLGKDNLLADPLTTANISIAEYEKYMAEMCTPKVQSEYGKLRSVLVHTPSEEIERLDPTCLNSYLLESRPAPRLAREQHAAFQRKIKENCKRPLILDVALLLYDILKHIDGEGRRRVIENILFSDELITLRSRLAASHLDFSPLLTTIINELCESHPEKITKVLLCGLNVADFPGSTPESSMLTTRSCQVIEPTPNLYFMRDPAFVLGKSLILSRMYWPIRRREPAILREIVKHHPFMENVRHNLVDWNPEADPFFSVEGGDAMAIAPGDYAIALSERTSRQAVRRIAEELINKGATRVFQPTIPVKRAFIHLDTVCSLAGPDHVLVHPEAMNAYAETFCWTSETIRDPGSEPKPLGKNFIKVLQEEFGKKVIETADSLEQFDDAANVFMVKPDTAVAYDRNDKTNKALKDHGIKVVEFMGSDLVVGRGGARCMTMPLRRD